MRHTALEEHRTAGEEAGRMVVAAVVELRTVEEDIGLAGERRTAVAEVEGIPAVGGMGYEMELRTAAAGAEGILDCIALVLGLEVVDILLVVRILGEEQESRRSRVEEGVLAADILEEGIAEVGVAGMEAAGNPLWIVSMFQIEETRCRSTHEAEVLRIAVDCHPGEEDMTWLLGLCRWWGRLECSSFRCSQRDYRGLNENDVYTQGDLYEVTKKRRPPHWGYAQD